MKFRPFKKQPSKEVKQENKRRWNIIIDQLYPILLTCENINDMTNCVKATELAIQSEMQVRVAKIKKDMQQEYLGTWAVKPLKGRGEEIERKLLEVLGTEKLEVVDEIITNLPRLIESFQKEEWLERKPESLKTHWPK